MSSGTARDNQRTVGDSSLTRFHENAAAGTQTVTRQPGTQPEPSLRQSSIDSVALGGIGRSTQTASLTGAQPGSGSSECDGTNRHQVRACVRAFFRRPAHGCYRSLSLSGRNGKPLHERRHFLESESECRGAEVRSEKSCDGGEEVLTLDESPSNAGEIHAIVLSVVRKTYDMTIRMIEFRCF